MKKESLLKDLSFDSNKPQIKVLMETEWAKEIRIAFAKGTSMRDHKTSFPISVEVVKGEIEFGIENTIHKLIEGDIISLEREIVHNLHANKQSIVRLTLSKNDSIDRVLKVIK